MILYNFVDKILWNHSLLPKKLKLKIKIGGGGYIVAGMFHFYTLKANFYYIK